MNSGYVIETDALTKRYGALEAVHALDLRVERHGITGFLGRNGAGKSSTTNHPLYTLVLFQGGCSYTNSSGLLQPEGDDGRPTGAGLPAAAKLARRDEVTPFGRAFRMVRLVIPRRALSPVEERRALMSSSRRSGSGCLSHGRLPRR